MEDSNEAANVVPELYFLIAKFLSGGPLKETAKTLLKELESVEVLPRRLDWEGNVHSQSFNELDSQYTEVSWRRLASVCERALQLARCAPVPLPLLATDHQQQQQQLSARLSLLSESLVRPTPQYASYKEDHSLVRRLVAREMGARPHYARAARPFPARLLRGVALQRRTLGHLSAVYCLAVERSGRFVLTGADDLLVKVWRTDGRLVATLRGAGAEITDVSASADGALLAAGSVERLVRVWCLVTGAPRAVLHAHQGTITSVAWAPPAECGTRRLASTSTDGSVAFWTGSADGQFAPRPVQYVERLRPGACHMICAAWSAGGAFLAAGSADQRVRVYALTGAGAAPRRVLETAAHSDAVDSLAWAHRGLRFVSGSKDGTAALWTLHATQWRHSALRANAPDERRLKVTMVCWDCSDAFVMTAVSDRSVRVWCARTGAQVRTLLGHRDEAYVLEAHPRLPGVLLSAGHDGQLFVWSAEEREPLARFHNRLAGQGEGALFDAKWAPDGAGVAATDSHGHLVLLGLGAGPPLLSRLPPELFFHTDYRPLARDALGGALDEQTELPPHLMPPPFLVDVEGAPHPPEFQRLVPGREALPLEQLVPRTRLDAMIEALAGEPAAGAAGEPPAHGVWRGEGVRHTAGSSWHGLDVPLSTRPIVPAAPRAVREQLEAAGAEMHAWETAWYRREMRRRPLMISTAGAGANGAGPGAAAGEGPRRRPGRRPRARPAPPRPAPAATAAPMRLQDELAVEALGASAGSDSSDESVHLSPSRSSHSTRSTRSSRSSRTSRSTDITDSDSTHTDGKSDDSSASSQYSDWEAGAALAPPARARRRPVPTTRYSPSAANTRRLTAGTSGASTSVAGTSVAGTSVAGTSVAGTSAATGTTVAPELPEAFRVGEWLTAVSPRKAPYHPQMGDHCLYFRLGHQRYFEAVAEKDLYKIHARDKPWELMQLYECEAVQVVGIKYAIKPPRVVCLRLSRARDGRAFTVRYHDMPDVIDFLVLRHHYDAAVARRWGGGDRFRCMIDDSWWTGQVLERLTPPAAAAPPPAALPDLGERWARDAAANFLSLRVRWDNGEVERLSPWDLEPLDPERLPAEPGGAVPVLPHELEAVLARAHEWPSAAARTIAHHISQVMSLAVAEPFVAPVDLQLYPSYAMLVPYPVDLATIRARFDNLFYRRAAAAQFDARYLATNAEQFNEPHSPIVRQARLVTDLLLHIISEWEQVDVVGKYHELAAAYHSSDDDDHRQKRKGHRARGNRRNDIPPQQNGVAPESARWEHACAALLRELSAAHDAEPFRQPVSPAQAPDYPAVVPRPMDLGTVRRRLEARRYACAADVAADVRLVFSNSRLYNTNKRSRIYSMTVRLSSLFEALWARLPAAVRRPRRARTHRGRPRRGTEPARASSGSASSEREPLAATSRRVHAQREPAPPASRNASRSRANRARADSWDSDVPLTTHRKGKGVGKKSKSTTTSASPGGLAADFPRATNGHSHSESEDTELRGAVRDGLRDSRRGGDRHRRRGSGSGGGAVRRARKRRRLRSSASSGRASPLKRVRERFSGSWSSSSSAAGSEPRSGARYESDRSYRPARADSDTDDDRPLLAYRGGGGGGGSGADGAGPSRRRADGGGVSLRRRGSPRRYNEDSEEDSVAAISKRGPHHQQLQLQQHQRAMMRRRHHAQGAAHVEAGASSGGAAGGAGVAGSAADADHNYFNGHAHNGAVYGAGAAGGGAGGASSGSGGSGPVSISSRGRVRKLTAKARGLLRH